MRNEMRHILVFVISLLLFSSARKGYAAVYVNTTEMGVIKSNAKKIEDGIFRKYPEVKEDKDRIWKESSKPLSELEAVFLVAEIQELSALGKPIIPIQGVRQVVASDWSDWNGVCTGYKKMYQKITGKHAGGTKTEGKDI